MRIGIAIVLGFLAAAPALAQTRPHPERPVDNGPFTPEANRAYMGGGVVLQGAPGAPAPSPSAVLQLPQTSSPPPLPPLPPR